MTSLDEQLQRYACYHRDRRNIATHFVGIPLIMVAVAVLLSRPSLVWAGWTLSPAWVLAALVGVYYLRLSWGLGALMGAVLVGVLALGQWAAAQSTSVWLGWGLGSFVVGWAFQGVGHVFEGRKPAFVDDLIGLLIGPLFVVVEVLGALGACHALRARIEAAAGPLRRGPAVRDVAGLN